MNRDEFLKERSTMVGGSDAHHLLNIAPYGCQRQLWYDKSGIQADEEFDITGPIRRGNRLEDVAVDYYCESTGRNTVKRERAIRHPEHPFIGVHVDREIVPWDEDPGPGVLEVKTVGEQMYWKVRREGLPDRYVLQIQWAMLCRGYQWGEFVVYWPDGDELVHFPVKPEAKIIAALKAAALEFWPRIASKTPPDRLRDDSEQCTECRWAMRCQGSHMRELLERWKEREKADPINVALSGFGEDYLEAKHVLDEAEKLMDELKSEIRHVMGEDLEGLMPAVPGEPGIKVSLKPDLTWDEERLKAERPELYAKFSKSRLDGTALSKKHPELESVYKNKPRQRRTLRIWAKEVTEK